MEQLQATEKKRNRCLNNVIANSVPVLKLALLRVLVEVGRTGILYHLVKGTLRT